jgi:hypothetical protein
MNAKHRNNPQPSTDWQSDAASAGWPESVEQRIGLDVQDGMMRVVIDGEVIDASSASSNDDASEGCAAFTRNQRDGEPAMHHPPRRARFRRLDSGEARQHRLTRDRSRGYRPFGRRPDLL